MREILFRGKRIDNEQWKEGYCLCLHSDEDMHIIVDSNGEYHRVSPETVGQYTGLTDKNGRKIFEGDIVYLYGDKGTLTEFVNYKALILFLHGGFCAIDGTQDDYGVCRFDFTSTLNCEVIGNKFDDPELLGGEADG